MARGRVQRLLDIILGLLHFATIGAADTCYWPNGKKFSSTACPSSTDDGHSACCSGGEACLENGLCRNNKGTVYRAGCTDRSWESDACPLPCRDFMYDDAGGFMNILPCRLQSGSTSAYEWCCATGDMSNDCCGNDELMVNNSQMLELGILTSTASSGVSATSTLAANGASATVTITQHASSPDSIQKNDATVVGAAVGVPLGIAAAAGWMAFLVLLRRQRIQQQTGMPSMPMTPIPTDSLAQMAHGYGDHHVEADGVVYRELEGSINSSSASNLKRT